MKIKLCADNYDILNTELSKINGRADTWTFSSIYSFAKNYELSAQDEILSYVDNNLTRKQKAGAVVTFISGSEHKIANSYKYQNKIIQTKLKFLIGSKDIFCIGIERVELKGKSSTKVSYTENQAHVLLELQLKQAKTKFGEATVCDYINSLDITTL